MVAPDGATLTEVLEEERFLQSIRSVGNWLKYAADDRKRSFKSLILVTGVIKCRSWNVAAISNSSRSNSGKVVLSLIPTASGAVTASHSWRECLPTICHSGPKHPSQTQNQCVFVRGYRIMKQNPLLRLRRKVKTTDLQEGSTEYYKLGETSGPRGTSASGSSQRTLSTSTQQSNNESTTAMESIADSGTISYGDYVTERLSNPNEVSNLTMNCVAFTDHGTYSQPYHPSDIINRYLLEQASIICMI
jgi:hypothetical protein